MGTALRRLPLALPLALALSALLFPSNALPLSAGALLLAVVVADVGLIRRTRRRVALQTDEERRDMFRKGLLGVAGMAGAAGLARAIPQAATATSAGLGFSRRLKVTGMGLREMDGKGHSELFNSAGDKVGDFYATSTSLEAPFGAATSTQIHQHVFVLPNGMLFGMGANGGRGEESNYSVLGGTGVYAGVSGVYQAVKSPRDSGGDGSATFKFRLKR
jgi:hypothetical protein